MNLKALWAENPRSKGGFFLTKLVALLDFMIGAGEDVEVTLSLATMLGVGETASEGLITFFWTDGDARASSMASW